MLNCSKIPVNWKQYYKDELHATISNSESLKSKLGITENIPNNGNKKDIELEIVLKYLSNFRRTSEMPLNNSEVKFILEILPGDCVISAANGSTRFTITGKKRYFPIVTLSTNDNSKLLQQLRSSFKGKINWNKYQSKVKIER